MTLLRTFPLFNRSPDDQGSPCGPRRASHRYHWEAAALAYVAVTLALALPVLPRLGSVIIGERVSDNFYETWSLWWFRQAVLSGTDPTHTHLVFALLPSVEVFMDHLFDDVIAFPLLTFMTPIGAYNVLILLGFVLAGLFAYLLAAELVDSRLAAFAAGFLYTFSTFHFARTLGQLGVFTLQWLPFCAWRLTALYRRPTVPNALLAGLGLALVAWSEIYYVAYFGVPFLLLFVAFLLVTDRGWLAKGRNLAVAALAALIAAGLAGPYLMTFVAVDADMRTTIAFWAQQGVVWFSADLLAFAFPNPFNPWLGHLALPLYRSMRCAGNYAQEAVFLGYPSMLLGLSAFFLPRNRHRFTFFWLTVTVFGVLLALGPTLLVGGRAVTAMPFYPLLYGWSAFSAFRTPHRLVVLPLLGVSVLAAYGLDGIGGWLARSSLDRVIMPALLVGALGFSLAENVLWGFTLPTTAAPIPQIEHTIAADSAPGSLLDLPLGPIPYAPYTEYYQFLQTVHHRPLAYGVAPRVSPRMVTSLWGRPYFAEFTLSGGGLARQALGGSIYQNVLTFRQELESTHIRYVILHRRDLSPADDQWATRYLRRQLGRPLYLSASVAAWRVEGTPPARALQFRLGSGWVLEDREANGAPDRAVDQDAQLLVDAPHAAHGTLRFLASGYARSRVLQIRLNGTLIATVRMTSPGRFREVTLRQVGLQAGSNTLTFHSVEGCTQAPAADFQPGYPFARCYSFDVQRVQWFS